LSLPLPVDCFSNLLIIFPWLAARGKSTRRLLLQSSHNLPIACGARKGYDKNPPVKPDFPTKIAAPVCTTASSRRLLCNLLKHFSLLRFRKVHPQSGPPSPPDSPFDCQIFRIGHHAYNLSCTTGNYCNEREFLQTDGTEAGEARA